MRAEIHLAVALVIDCKDVMLANNSNNFYLFVTMFMKFNMLAAWLAGGVQFVNSVHLVNIMRH